MERNECYLLAAIHKKFDPIHEKLYLSIGNERMILDPLSDGHAVGEAKKLEDYVRYDVGVYKFSVPLAIRLANASKATARLDYGDGRFDEGSFDMRSSDKMSRARKTVMEFILESTDMFRQPQEAISSDKLK